MGGVKMSSINMSSLAKELFDALRDARQRELDLARDLTDEQLLGERLRIVEPPLWELGHVGWFQERWILRKLYGDAPLLPQADALYDSFNIPNVERWDLDFPSRQQTLAYMQAVLQRTCERLQTRALGNDDAYFYRLALYHEDMHTETMHHIRHTHGYSRPTLAANATPLSAPKIDLDFEPHDVAIPGGTYCLGATRDIPFVWDNEKWLHPIVLKPFYLSATPVTVADYQAFVEQGGYAARDLWSDEGWEWRQRAKASQPAYWKRASDGTWTAREFDVWSPLAPTQPMTHVNWYEANAYCAWAGRRLPTEAEWELAASAEPAADGRGFTGRKRLYAWGDDAATPERANLDSRRMGVLDVRALPEGDSAFGCRQMIGNVWEWTADTFDAYPGFELQPYKEYSEPSFKQQKVLRGGCWATRARVIRNTYRNFYTPDRNNIYAGFRTCAR